MSVTEWHFVAIEIRMPYYGSTIWESTAPILSRIQRSACSSICVASRFNTTRCSPLKYRSRLHAGYTVRDVPPMRSTSAAAMARTACSTVCSGKCGTGESNKNKWERLWKMTVDFCLLLRYKANRQFKRFYLACADGQNYACKAGCDLQRAGRNKVTSNP